MGQNTPNCELIEDHATPNTDSCIRLHMDLSISYADAAAYRPKFESGDWSSVAEDLAEQNPQYSEIIKAFISAASERKANEAGPTLKVVAA